MGHALFYLGELTEARDQATNPAGPARHHSYFSWKAFCLSYSGWVSWPLGQPEQTEAYAGLARAREALGVLEEAAALVDSTGERWSHAEILRLRGELLARPSETAGVLREAVAAEVEGCFRQALEVARRQRAKSLELRAARSLSRLWQHQRQPGRARHLLGQVHGWFREGLDTTDLREARALLDELPAG